MNKQVTNKIKVLIIDDDIGVQQNLRQTLILDRKNRFDVNTFGEPDTPISENDVLNIVADMQPDVVLLDNRFAQGDVGIEQLLPMIRGMDRYLSIYIITAHRKSDTTQIFEAVSWGAEGFLDKPLDNDSVIEKVLEGYELSQKRRQGV